MTIRELVQPIRGIIPPLATPLTKADELDCGGLERLIEHVIGGGVHGLFLLGTCGEGPSLSYRLRRQVVENVCRQVDGRVPVLVSITDTSLAESLAAARHAAEAGADAVVLAPPFYYPIDQAALVAYVLQVVEATPLPIVLYNMPSLTKIAFEPASVRRLMQEEAIVGLKDSSGDLDYFQKIRQLCTPRPDWTLLMGPEHLLARSLELGGDGGVSGGANIFPQLFVQIYEAATAKQQDVLRHLVDKVDRLGQIYQFGPLTASSVIKGLKSGLAALGICGNCVAPPLESHTADEQQQVADVLRSLGVRSAAVAS
jgi:4-hydroxy-tetrahydrodipicolinate synthase